MVQFFHRDNLKWDGGTIEESEYVCTYKRHADVRETVIVLTGARVNVTIKIFGNYRFEGYVLSLDEFKLIWERIL